jgi:hypothetical protein
MFVFKYQVFNYIKNSLEYLHNLYYHHIYLNLQIVYFKLCFNFNNNLSDFMNKYHHLKLQLHHYN